MAPQVPIIEQDVEVRPVGGQGMLQKVSNPYIARTTGLEDAAMAIAKKAEEDDDELAMIEAQKAMDDWGSRNLNSSETGAFNYKGKDAFGVAKKYTDQFDKDMQSYAEQNLKTDKQRLMFRRMWVGRRGSNLNQLDNHESREKTGYVDEQTKAATVSSVNRAVDNYQDPAIFQASIDGARAPTLLRAKKNGLLTYKEDGSLDMENLSPSVKLELETIDSTVYFGAFSRMADASPKQAVDFFKNNSTKFKGEDLGKASAMALSAERKYKARDVASNVLRAYHPPVNQDDIIKNTIRLEGGDQTVTDVNGSPARAGLNLKFMEVDDNEADRARVKKLTGKDLPKKMRPMTKEELAAMSEEDIINYYKKNYWDAAKIGDLPPAIQSVAYDAVVQHGVDAETLGAIEAANGDPMKLLEWRYKKLERLIKRDPEKWKPLERGIKNRYRDLAIAANQQPNEIPDEFEVIRRIDEEADDLEVAKDAKVLAKESIAAMKAVREENFKAAADRVQGAINNGTEPREEDIAAMKPDDVKAMRNAEPDPGLYWTLKSAVSNGEEVDLAKYRWTLGGKYNELLEIQNDPEKQVNARKVTDVMKSAQGLIIGKAAPSTESDFKKMEAFERKFNERMAQEAKGAKGVKPGADVAQRVLDELLIEVRSKDPKVDTWNSSHKMFEVSDTDEINSYPGVETGWVYTIGDKKRSYNEVVRLLRDTLIMKDLVPDEKNMKDAYEKLLEKKILKRFQ